MYTLVFTSVPIIFVGIFEEDISRDWLLKYPQLYRECIAKKFFNFRVYMFWIAIALYQGAFCWGISTWMFNESASSDAKYPGLMGESIINVSYIVVIANLQLARIIK